jgi:hypothetical protein
VLNVDLSVYCILAEMGGWVGGSSVSRVVRSIVLAAGIRAGMERKAAARLNHKGKITKSQNYRMTKITKGPWGSECWSQTLCI